MLDRIKLYIVSLWLLFLLIIIKEINYDTWSSDLDLITNLQSLTSFSVLSYTALFFLLLGGGFLINLRWKVKGTMNLPKKITKIKNLNYEHLTFLTTYIIPFICFELGDVGDTIIFSFLLIVIGAIYVKTNLFYSNPTLALLGYQIYSVETDLETDIILIAQGELKDGESFTNLKVADMVYYAKVKSKPKNNE